MDNEILCLDHSDVWRTLHRVNPQKTADLTDIYNISLRQAIVPHWFKKLKLLSPDHQNTKL